MMLIYLPVKFEFDRTKHFRVRVWKQNCRRADRLTDVRYINLIDGLVTRNSPKNHFPGSNYLSNLKILIT